MNWWDRFLLMFASKGVKESVLAPAGSATDPDDHLYRPLTERSPADLPQWQHDKMLKIALHLDRSNPIARRLLDMIRDFVWAEGFRISAVNSDVRWVLDRHWNDPVNRWNRRGPRLLRLLLRDGEVVVPAAVNPVNGFVRYGTIPSRQVKGVRPHPENWEVIQTITLKDDSIEGRSINAINIDWDAQNGSMAGRLDGDAFFWKINDDGVRGISLLYALADYCDALERFLFNEVERWQLMKSHIWDVTIQGATAEQIQQMVQTDSRFQSPRPGSVRVHNESESWKAESPELGAYEAVAGMKFVRNFIVGTTGFPEHWFGEGGDVNRAVGTVMDEPTIKMLTTVQEMIRDLMIDSLQFVIDKAVEHGELPDLVPKQDDEGNDTDELVDPRDAFTLSAPDMSTRNMSDVAQTLVQSTNALIQAEASEYITTETSRQIFAAVASQLGVDINADTEGEKIQKAREAAGNEQIPEAQRARFDMAMNGNGRS